jgi:hypothetical protein
MHDFKKIYPGYFEYQGSSGTLIIYHNWTLFYSYYFLDNIFILQSHSLIKRVGLLKVGTISGKAAMSFRILFGNSTFI